MKEIGSQLLSAWKGMKPKQKGMIVAITCSVLVLLGYFIFHASIPSRIPLYSYELTANDQIEVRHYLENEKFPFEENKKEGFLVRQEDASRIRRDLAAQGIPRQEQSKGYELFDTNTWIKGDKELQVLEMRALKGQLEKDIAAYENIKSANVILDMAPARPFGGAQYPTKASVILSLLPGARLSTSQLQAITYHLAGAVRGLEANMIAISDTTGKLYQTIDPDAKGEVKNNPQTLFEERIQEKIEGLLTKIVGKDQYYITVQVIMHPETEKVESLSVIVLLERALVNDHKNEEMWASDIEKQLKILLKGYGVDESDLSVHFVPFGKKTPVPKESKENKGLTGMVIMFIILVFSLLAMLPLFMQFKQKRKSKAEQEDPLLKFKTQIDFAHLATAVEKENPETIAMLLSYLTPTRAEQILIALPPELQERVLFHLSKLEKEV